MKMKMESGSEYSKLMSSCRRCCMGFTFTLSLTALFLCLTLLPSAPVIYLNYCYVNITDPAVFISFYPENSNMDKEIYYDDFSVTLSFYQYYNSGIIPVGNALASGFHQKCRIRDNLYGEYFLPNVTIPSESENFKNELSIDEISFHVRVMATWRCIIMGRMTGPNYMMVGSNFYCRRNPPYKDRMDCLTDGTKLERNCCHPRCWFADSCYAGKNSTYLGESPTAAVTSFSCFKRGL